MAGFAVPDSTPPSTPDSHRASRNAPSTTPAGPPPTFGSYIPSSTPAGPPPQSSLFGSARPMSRPNFQNSNLGSSPPKNTSFGGFRVPSSSTTSDTRGRTGLPQPRSSPPHVLGFDEGEEDEDMMDEEGDLDDDDRMDEDAEGDEEYDEDEQYAEDEEEEAYGHLSRRAPGRRSGPAEGRLFGESRNSLVDPSQIAAPMRAIKQQKYDLLRLAKGLASRNHRAKLEESDEMIIETERLMGRLQDSVTSDTPGRRSEILAEVAQELIQVWRATTDASLGANTSAASRSTSRSATANANRLASLLLRIHYPDEAPRSNRSLTFSTMSTRTHQNPLPKVLMAWMNTYWVNSSEIGLVLGTQRGYSAHPSFWEAVKYSILRGNLSVTLKLLRGARFEAAETAALDGLGEYGYSGVHLRNINSAVNSAIDVLQSCPAIVAEDWDVKGSDWDNFRHRVSQALSELEDFAEGDNRGRNSMARSLQADQFSFSQSQSNFKLSLASRRAESNIPWTVYENLVLFYRQLLGEDEVIVATALDWVEAVIGLTMWWNGEDDEVPEDNLAASRLSVSRSRRARMVDLTPVPAYCQRLSTALAMVVDSEEDLSINTTDPYEVGLACIFEHNIDGFLQTVRHWSALIASAVAEVASSGDWLKQSEGLMDTFDQSDLMVLSYTDESRNGISKDDLLVTYATLLAKKANVQSQDRKTTREGWELAIQVLGRLNDERAAKDRIDALLKGIPLDSTQRVDKILDLCNILEFSEQSSSIALKYAEQLSSTTENYGDTLVYYARAHNSAKIQEVLHILVSHCLVKSISYPPSSQLDERLKALITSPRLTLTQLSRIDPEAAQLLSTYLSGYATIRKFYDLRDEALLAPQDNRPSHRPMARNRAAAAALMVVISSAASSIQGGLYDPSVETVVKVDVLLSLLGEALVFVNQPKRTLTLPYLHALLEAIEDFETAPSLIRAQCEECFSSTLAAAHGDEVPSPRTTLHKSTSNLTTASSYSMLGSSVFPSGGEGQSTESSAVLIKGGNVDDGKRAWDWRKGFKKDARGEDVIRILRLGISEELGRAALEGS